MITVTFSLTFTIKTPQKNAQGNYQYDSNGNQLFTTRTDGPYTGSGSATLTVRNGKFEVKIKPDVLIPQYTGDSDGYRNKLGIGEAATILVSFHNVTFQERECIGIGEGYFQGEQDEHHTILNWSTCIV
ncbi:MAG: hypothetical protein LBG58_11710, partial [Planctomycetaceae bacterium]|nr:hypothetical protein [Planctomycetaceae bacterium]